MKNYYCLVAGLPDLTLDDGKLNFTLEQFKEEIYPELSTNDKKIIDLFFLDIDNKNLISLLNDKDKPIVNIGNFTSDELLSLISSIKDGEEADKKFPSYLISFLKEYLFGDDMRSCEDSLSSHFYAYAMNNRNKFISNWYEFNLNTNNIFSAFQARKYHMNVASVIVGHNDISEKLRTSNARDFGVSELLSYFDNLQRINDIESLVEREKKIDQMKWEWMDDAIFFNYFSIERIFAFLVKINMINRWSSLDREKGKELFTKLIDSLKDDVSIPQEFR